jgi:glycine betaine/proline transport system ATP-binding protein
VKADDPLDGPEMDSSATIRSAVHVAAATDRPIRVVEKGTLVGMVDRVQILSAISGAEPDL